MLNVMLVDDEAASRRALRECCGQEPDVQIIGEYGGGEDALEAIRSQPPHVLFLDINMETMDGMTLVRALGESPLPLVVFVTAYEQYALEAFEVSAVDYLLKPFDRNRFRGTIERVRRRIEGQSAAQRRDALDGMIERIEAADNARTEERPHILVRLGGRLQMLDPELIELVTAHRNYVKVRVGRETYTVRSTLQHTEKTLQALPMVRVNRSCLVNLNHVRRISHTPRGDIILVLSGGTTITSSQGCREAVRQQLVRLSVEPDCYET